MSSPQWSSPTSPPLFAALAAAQHDAWRAPESDRRTRFSHRLRQQLGAAAADKIMLSALALFDAQPSAPEGYLDPPANMHFECCPHCQALSGKRYSQAPSGRIRLNALRDREWLEWRLERGGTSHTIAKSLGCTADSVRLWIDKHGLERRRNLLNDEEVGRLHDQGLAPGEISRQLDVRVSSIRKILFRVRGVTRKSGNHYAERSWWVKRLVEQQMTTAECAAAAGIYKHNATYYVTKFGLSETTKARTYKKGQRIARKYPELADPVRLKALMDEHQSYDQVSIAISGTRHNASNVRNWWLRHFGTQPDHVLLRRRSKLAKGVPHSRREWWVERLNRGDTMRALAAEAGIAEGSARDRLRVFGGDLLAQGYRNNLTAEKRRRGAA